MTKTSPRYNERIFEKFAIYYDAIYSDKNYRKECDFIKSVLGRKPIRVLDIGCGTGGHSLILANEGYRMVAIDLSRTALDIAKRKAQDLGVEINFINNNMLSFHLNQTFDACISMFCSLGYISKIVEFRRVLERIFSHLKPGGILVFDFWNGNTVVSEKPTTKVKIVSNGNQRIIRIATPKLDLEDQSCDISYHCLIDGDSKIIDEFNETHKIRYFFPADLKVYLEDAGFEFLRLADINNTEVKGSKLLESWYLYAIARKPR